MSETLKPCPICQHPLPKEMRPGWWDFQCGNCHSCISQYGLGGGRRMPECVRELLECTGIRDHAANCGDSESGCAQRIAAVRKYYGEEK